jgi:hypothetical protein
MDGPGNKPSETPRAESPLACDMRAIPTDQREGHLAKTRALFALIEEIKELPDGYEFRLAAGSNTLVDAAEFVSHEKLCCPFLRFAIEAEPDNGPLWLRLTGRDGVKGFIREEVNGLLGVLIDWK